MCYANDFKSFTLYSESTSQLFYLVTIKEGLWLPFIINHVQYFTEYKNVSLGQTCTASISEGAAAAVLTNRRWRAATAGRLLDLDPLW